MKWVDDHIFFRIPWAHHSKYNKHRSIWQQEILSCGGCRQCGSQLWYGGRNLPGGSLEEFDEDCSTVLTDLAETSPHNEEDRSFTYADADIDRISSLLGIQWEPSKSVPFGTKVPYLGFRWDLHAHVVHLLEEKRVKYLAVIMEWEKDHTHNLLETQQLYGKLLHTTLVLPAGQAYLTNLEAMLALVMFELNIRLDLSREATTKSLCPLYVEFLLQVLCKSTWTVAVWVIRSDEGVGDFPGVRGGSGES